MCTCVLVFLPTDLEIPPYKYVSVHWKFAWSVYSRGMLMRDLAGNA